MKRVNALEKKPTRIPVIEGEWKGEKVKFRPDRIVVKLKTAKEEKDYEFLKGKGNDISSHVPDSKVLRYPKKTPLLVLKVPEKSNVVELAEEISKREDVVYAEPDFVGTMSISTEFDGVVVTLFDVPVSRLSIFTLKKPSVFRLMEPICRVHRRKRHRVSPVD